ncbi:MAG: hypothetical protein H6Q59_3274, partial [Firmicutes bacterium]|nr:hypothetical protein [Bacillota bacterium]
KRRSINIGIIVFLILFLYIAINVYIYFTKEQLSIYEVHEGSTAIDNRITALILRDEQTVTTDKAGYVSYYQKEGARIAKNSTVYSLDDSGQMVDILATGDVPITMSDKNNAELLHAIDDFRNSFSDNNYKQVYDFKENVGSTVLDILNTTMISNEQTLMEETGQTFSYNMVRSPQSGIVSYYTDGYEAVTPDAVNTDMFKPDEYTRTSLRTTDIVDVNTPIYKLITSEQWKLVLPLTEEQYDKLQGKEQVRFTVLEDDFDMTAALSLSKRGSEYYGELTLNKYLSNYLEERYLEVQLDFDTVEGLKIPLTSIIDKDFFLVPLEYFTMGADSTDTGLIIETYDEKSGEAKYTFFPTEVYFKDDAYAYIDTDQFPAGTYIHSSTNTERYTLGPTNKLTGVYNVNLGYAVFKRIDVLYQNEEYAIISEDTENGLSAYDQIALDGSTAKNQAIIY